MKRFILTFCILTAITLSVFPQMGFRPGYVVKINGDTLNGLVYYGPDQGFDNGCKFKRFEIAREFKYDVASIKSFAFLEGRNFEALDINGKIRFMECLVKGEISIYTKPGAVSGDYYIRHSGSLISVISKSGSKVSGTGNFKDYKEALKQILKGFESSIDQTKYSKEELVNLISEYNEHSDAKNYIFNQTRSISTLGDYSLSVKKPYLNYGFTIGYQITNPTFQETLDFSMRPDEYSIVQSLDMADYISTNRFLFGMYLNRLFSVYGSRYSYDVALLFYKDDYYGHSEYIKYSEEYKDDIYIDITALQIPVSLKMNFGNKALQPYIKVGASYTYLLQSDYLMISEKNSGYDIITTTDRSMILAGDAGFHGSAGIDFFIGYARKISLDVTYQLDFITVKSSRDFRSKLSSNNISLMLRCNL